MPGHDVAMDQIRFAELLEHPPDPHFICRNEVSEPLQGMSGFGVIDIVFHDIPATLLLVRPVFPSRFSLDKEDADLVVKCCCLGMFAHEKAFHLIESVRVPGGKEQDFHGYVSNVF